MNEQQKQRIEELVKALRSREYRQWQNGLRIEDFNEQKRYCCLGVACEISKLGEWIEDDDEYQDSLGTSSGLLSPEVADYYGLSPAQQVDLARMNDDGLDFATIANYIEQQFLSATGGEE